MSKVKCLFEKIEYGTTLKRNCEERSRGGGFNLLAHYQVGKQSSGIQWQSKVHQVLGGWDSVFRSKNILELYLFVVSNKETNVYLKVVGNLNAMIGLKARQTLWNHLSNLIARI